MRLFRKGEAQEEPEVKLDLSEIAEYRYSDETELEPGQELAIHQGLGVTALREAKFNREYLLLTERITGETGTDTTTIVV